LIWLAIGDFGVAGTEPPGVLVTIGEVTETGAVVWVRGLTDAPLAVELMDGDRTVRRLVIEPDRTRDLTGRAKLGGLAPGRRYDYRIHGAEGVVTGHFVTAPPADRPAPLRLLWSADLGSSSFCRRTDTGYAIFDAMAARAPDRFLFLGDTIYADRRCRGNDIVPGAQFVARTLPEFQAKHRYNREDPAVQRFFRRTAVWATWDDHDVDSNFAGTTEPLLPVGRQAFMDYWPIDAASGEPTRLYRSFRHGTAAEIFVLDTRQYRSDNCRRDSRDKTLLGEQQRRWLIESLAASNAVWKLVASSVPLSITKNWPCGDSWAPRDLLVLSTGFAAERDAILRALHDRGVTNVVFLAGDVHFALFAAHEPWPGFRVHELIAGPLSARPQRARMPDGTLGSQVLFSAGRVPTFGELDVTPDGLTARVYDGSGTLLGTTHLTRRRRRRQDLPTGERKRVSCSHGSYQCPATAPAPKPRSPPGACPVPRPRAVRAARVSGVHVAAAGASGGDGARGCRGRDVFAR
jgi:alkaline phosphatase D